MAINEFTIRRTAFANFTVPAGVTDTVLTVATTTIIPTGALITGIRFFPYAAFTGAATYANATITPYVGGVAIGSNDSKVTEAIVQTVVATGELVAAEGFFIKTGGFLNLCFGTTNVATSGVTADCDVYIDYILCPDRDKA